MATCAVPWSTRLLLHTTSQTHVELLQREMRAAPRAHRLPAVHAVLSYAVMAEAGLLPVPARRIVLAARLLAKARALPEGDPLRAVADADPAQAQVRDGLAPGRDRGLASRRRGPAVGAVVPGPAAGMRWPTHRSSAYSRTSAPCAGTPRLTRPSASTARVAPATGQVGLDGRLGNRRSG